MKDFKDFISAIDYEALEENITNTVLADSDIHPEELSIQEQIKRISYATTFSVLNAYHQWMNNNNQ